MRWVIFGMTAATLGLFAWPASAQPPGGPPQPGEAVRGPQARQTALEQFDQDGDGRLSETERQAARESMGGRRGARAANRQQFFAQRGGPGRRGGRGPRGGFGPAVGVDQPPPDGPPVAEGTPMRNLEPLFGWFDRDRDGQLSRQEFAELSQFVRRQVEDRPRREVGPADAPGGPRFGRRGGPFGPGGGERGFGRGGRGRGGPAGRGGRGGRGRGDGDGGATAPPTVETPVDETPVDESQPDEQPVPTDAD